MTRQEYLEWAKARALEYIALDETMDAWMSFVSDLEKHEATAGHIAVELGMQLILAGHLNTPSEMKKFIEGFN